MNIIIEHILKRVEQVDGKGLYIKVLRYIRIFSSLMILLLKLCQYININCSIIPGELWDINARNFINKYILTVIGSWIVCGILLRCLWIFSDIDEEIFPIYWTMIDLIDGAGSGYVMVYVINKLIESYNGIVFNNRLVVLVVALYLLCYVCKSLYEKNYRNYSSWKRVYTGYCDSAGRRIYENTTVFYYGDEYKISKPALGSCILNDSKKSEWSLKSVMESEESITLERAASDREGNIRLAK